MRGGNKLKRKGARIQAHPGVAFEDLDDAARRVSDRISEMPLECDADFENGSLGRVERLGPDWYQIVLRPDTWYRFFFRIKGCRKREIVFEFTCRDINNPAYNEGRHRWEDQGKPIHPLISYDRQQWLPVDHIEKHAQDPGKFRFRHTFKEDEAYLSHHHPYTYSDMLGWVKTLQGRSSRVRVESLGNTRNGFLQPVLTVADNPACRVLVVIIAREDADEVTGSWGCEGLVRALLSRKFMQLRKRHVFKIVPMVGIDGVVAGAHHSAGYGYGGNRWHERPSPVEIENVKRAMKQWIAQGYVLKMAGKVHGYESFKRWDTPLCDGIRTSSMVVKTKMEQAIMRYSGGKWEHTNKDISIRRKGLFERFVLDEFGLQSVFSTHITGGTPDESRRGGEALMHGVGAWLQAQ